MPKIKQDIYREITDARIPEVNLNELKELLQEEVYSQSEVDEIQTKVIQAEYNNRQVWLKEEINKKISSLRQKLKDKCHCDDPECKNYSEKPDEYCKKEHVLCLYIDTIDSVFDEVQNDKPR